MKYATEGYATDSAFTIGISGRPVRHLKIFESKAELLKEQERIWKESGGERNLIPCSAEFARKNYPDNF